MSFRLIAFCGKSGTGKTTFAFETMKLLNKIRLGSCKQAVMSLATPLKTMTSHITDPIERRKAQQHLGDDLRAKDPLAIINILDRAIKESGAEVVAIDDIRTNDEEKWVKDNGGILIQMTMPEDSRLTRLMARDGKIPDDEIKLHSTENAEFQPHYKINNINYSDTAFLIEFILRVDSGWCQMESSLIFKGSEHCGEKGSDEIEPAA